MKIILISLLLFPFFGIAQSNNSKKLTINGSVKGLPENSEVSLSDLNNPEDTISKAIVENGRFTLTGSLQEPNLYNLNFAGVAKKTVLFIDNEIISITGEISNLEGFSYSGSKTHELFLNFQKIFNPLFRELGEYSKKLQAVPDSDPTKQALFAEYTSQLNKIKESIASFLKENSTSPIGAFMLLVTSELEEDIQKLKSQYDQLAAEVKNSFYGKILLSQINDALVGSIGSPAPDFTQEDTSGNAVALNSFKGKYVLIDFWASWCGPCRQENPNVVQAFNRFKNKNFTVLGISLDRDKNAWLEAIKEDQLWWTQLSDLKFWSNAVAVQYRVQSIPQNYLIDPDGIIIAKDLRGRELQSKLCELFGCD